MSELHVFSDGCEWAIAKNKDDLVLVMNEFNGTDDFVPEHWEEEPHEKKLKISCDDLGMPCEHGEGQVVTLTHREWCEKMGRGYLCTTEQ